MTAVLDLEALLNLSRATVVLELNWVDGADDDFRQALRAASSAYLVPSAQTEAVDLVIVWRRRHDGDLSDSLLDALRLLTDGGAICLATPKPGSPEYVDAIDISDIAKELNLRQTGTFVIGPDWRATKLQT